ncbi:hypothetical protein D6789_02340 [Candidatus Woesearchaeota archaeon]|nr:MAG: hypothetical protein D6789_02340 [Candidatus Woesearchaeota archaeon]
MQLEERLYGKPQNVSIGALVLRGSELPPPKARVPPDSVVEEVQRKRRIVAPTLAQLAQGGLVPGLGVQMPYSSFSYYGELTLAVLEELGRFPLEAFYDSLRETYDATASVMRAWMRGAPEEATLDVIERKRLEFQYEQRMHDVATTYSLLSEILQLGKGTLPERYEDELVTMLAQYNKKPVEVTLYRNSGGERARAPLLVETKTKLGASIIQKLSDRLAKRALELSLEDELEEYLRLLHEGSARPHLPDELFAVTVDDAFGARFTFLHWDELEEARHLLTEAHARGVFPRDETLGKAALEDRIHLIRVAEPHTALHSTHLAPMPGNTFGPDHVEVQLMPAYAKLFDHLHESANRFLLDEARHERRQPREKQLYLSLLSHFEQRYRGWLRRGGPSQGNS